MSKKKIENAESLLVDVDSDVTSVSLSDIAAGIGEPCVVDVDSKPKKSKKKVVDVALERQIVDLEEALSKAKDAIESASADNERLADELGVCTEENKTLRKELSKSKQDFRRVQSDNRANSALVDTLNGELTRLKVQNKELMDTISRLQDSVKHYSDESAAKDVSIREYEFDIATRDNEIREMRVDIEQLRSDLVRIKGLSVWNRVVFLFTGRIKYSDD